jgi:hypothetical protein
LPGLHCQSPRARALAHRNDWVCSDSCPALQTYATLQALPLPPTV